MNAYEKDDGGHPGRMVFVDGNTGQVIRECPIDEIPPKHRYHQTEKGRIPIVRVVATKVDNQQTIREYGPDGDLLRSTLAFID